MPFGTRLVYGIDANASLVCQHRRLVCKDTAAPGMRPMGREWVASLQTKEHLFWQYVPRIPGHGKVTARPACHARPLEVDPLWQQEEVDAEAAIQRLTVFSFKRCQGHQERKGLL